MSAEYRVPDDLQPMVEAQDWGRLVQTLDQRAAASDGDARPDLLRAAAAIAEQELCDLDYAIDLLRMIFHDHPADVQTLLELERLAVLLMDWSMAVEVMETRAKVLASPEEVIALRLQLANMLELQLDDVAGARAQYQAVLAMAPDHTDAKDALARL